MLGPIVQFESVSRARGRKVRMPCAVTSAHRYTLPELLLTAASALIPRLHTPTTLALVCSFQTRPAPSHCSCSTPSLPWSYSPLTLVLVLAPSFSFFPSPFSSHSPSRSRQASLIPGTEACISVKQELTQRRISVGSPSNVKISAC